MLQARRALLFVTLAAWLLAVGAPVQSQTPVHGTISADTVWTVAEVARELRCLA